VVHNVRFINPKTIAKPPGYTHVVEITGPGRVVHIAGQLGLDTSGKLVGTPGDFSVQAAQAFENLKAALGAVGAGVETSLRSTVTSSILARISVRSANCAIAISTWRHRRPAPR
jgi:enamine deaminase RidA (YjgF/YER057c/UK114 family)